MTPRASRQKRWVVRAGDGLTVADIVKRAGEGEHVIAQGRVFVGRTRIVTGTHPVRPGDDVTIGAGAGAAARTPGSEGPRAHILWEREGLLACEKEAGIPTVPDHGGASHALVALAAAAIGKAAGELRITSRLDREVSGVVIFAITAEAEARLRAAREQGRYTRRYVAIARAAEGSTEGTWDAPIGRGKDARHRAVLGPEAKPAQTRWRVVARAGDYALLAVEPQTGRTHQIRVHASHAGAPLLGDRDYGGAVRATLPGGRVLSLARIALHAARVTVPSAHEGELVASAPIPAALAGAWTDLGGAPEAWDTAVSCSLKP